MYASQQSIVSLCSLALRRRGWPYPLLQTHNVFIGLIALIIIYWILK